MSEFPNCEIKLCDMESARVIQEDEHIREVIGTPDYVGEFIQLLLISLRQAGVDSLPIRIKPAPTPRVRVDLSLMESV